MYNRIDLVAGQNCPLPASALHVTVATGRKISGPDLDLSAFLLNAQGKVSRDDDFVFYNQPVRADQGVELEAEQNRLTLHLGRTQSEVTKIALTITITDGQAKGQGFAEVQQVTVLVKDFLTGIEIASFALDTSKNQETALILAEFYRHQDKWKLRAVGQGFIGGLQPLAEFYGVDISEGESSPAQQPTLSPEPAPPQKLNLSKITLEKRGQSISLEKNREGLGEILVNLNWNAVPVKSTGLFGRKAEGIDLDLACLWEFQDGARGAVQALGGHFGNLRQFPFIELDQDDRSGRSVGGETMRINGSHWQEFSRVLIFAFIYEGVPNWSHVDAVITIKCKNQPAIEVRLDSHRNDQFMCAIAMLENVNGQLRITKLVDYFSGHQQMDHAYGWCLNYVAGSK
ncbi:TerD family protein [Methylomicrobium sp. Wu6]|uniref:TerD family protein n=1 Tax=Methylomicrobium sp. Wu6 TaxID=3107928 RepID=UPI002DD6B9D3|nr:TerD family protein [Methylomicrobium sp. Wu6]MEC4750527.1 TerD family protein [Methylomicrobium sp. Wu6]